MVKTICCEILGLKWNPSLNFETFEEVAQVKVAARIYPGDLLIYVSQVCVKPGSLYEEKIELICRSRITCRCLCMGVIDFIQHYETNHRNRAKNSTGNP